MTCFLKFGLRFNLMFSLFHRRFSPLSCGIQHWLIFLLAVTALLLFPSEGQGAPKSIPLIYCTDLFHPPDDPDDHVDLATLFALPELEVRAIILDQGLSQRERSGEIPLRQMMTLTGKQTPYAAGLANPLRYPEDTGRNQFPFYQAGVEMILRVLRESNQKVTVITTGSVRDVIAAFNRDPRLFENRIDRIYVTAGNSAGGDLHWNPNLDPQAYLRLMRSTLPIYWCPCFGGQETIETLIAERLPIQQYQTFWKFRQGDLFESLSNPLQNFFLYALGRKIPVNDDPISYLERKLEEQLKSKEWKQPRNMWSTASLYHAASRQLYHSTTEWAALSEPIQNFTLSPVYDFVSVDVTIDLDLRTTMKPANDPRPIKIFHLLQLDHYQDAMTSSLRRLLSEMPINRRFSSRP